MRQFFGIMLFCATGLLHRLYCQHPSLLPIIFVVRGAGTKAGSFCKSYVVSLYGLYRVSTPFIYIYILLEIIYFRFRYGLIIFIFSLWTSRRVSTCKADITHTHTHTHTHTKIYYVLSVDNVATCFEHYVVIFRLLKYTTENYSCKFIFVWVVKDLSLWVLQYRPI
jgi:hypothetical protein